MGLFSKDKKPVTKRLDESVVPAEIQELERAMASKVAGQDRAIKQFVRVHETFMAGLAPADRPLSVMLFVGPTGSGKTHVVETFAELMDVTLIKIDCAEFQASHEISKLLGSPPGYVGGEIPPKITKESIEAKWSNSKGPKYSVILFDEIEKGHNALHQILLGIMDRGTITTGKNVTIDLKQCIIVMTSNLGSGEVKKLLRTNGGYGFIKNAEVGKPGGESSIDQEIYTASKEAVTKFFTPEFFNRVDKMIVFRSLTDEMLRRILDIELVRVQDRVLKSGKFVSVEASNRGKDFLIEKGTSKEFGARELRRTIERYLISKLTRAFTTKQAEDGDMLIADKEPNDSGLTLDIAKDAMVIPSKEEPENKTTDIVHQPRRVYIDPENRYASTPYRGVNNSDYCGRCGYRWYTAHKCFDLVQREDLDLYKKPRR